MFVSALRQNSVIFFDVILWSYIVDDKNINSEYCFCVQYCVMFMAVGREHLSCKMQCRVLNGGLA